MRSKGRGGGTGPERIRTGAPSAALVLLTAIVAAAGCGIQSYPYLAPVDDIRQPLTGETVFEFTNRTDNDSTFFYGYEIYYKFYSTDTGSVFDTEESTLINGVSYSQATGTLGFHRLVVNTLSTEKPLVYVEPGDRNSSFPITIDFSVLSTVDFPIISYNTKTVEAARYVVGPDGTDDYFSFSPSELTAAYEDITAEMLTGPGDIRLALIVFTYGKQNVYQDLYSAEAAYLGSITLSTS
jgi:hypothetical protein